MNNSKSLKKPRSFAEFYTKFGIFVILIIAIVVAAILSDAFLTPRNLLNILRQNAVILVIAMGAQMVLISGEVDLSPGSVCAFAGCVSAMTMQSTNSVVLSICVGLLCGLMFGVFNGWIITACGIPSFIMTLATQFIGRGGILAITSAQPITGLPTSYGVLGQGYLGLIPVPIVISVIVLLIYWVMMNRMRYGRFVYAVGGNMDAATASGINAKLIKIKSFAFAGLMAGLGGVLLMSRMKSGQPNAADAYEFDAITAAIVGGTSMSGGQGSVYGMIAGWLFVAVLINIMTLMNVSAYSQKILRGVIIAVAVIIDARVRKATTKA